MRPYKNNHKRQKFRTNGDRSLNRNLDNQSIISNTNFQRKPHRNNNQSASRLIEKYNNLAREALSSGDKILSENYLQHADHFSRVLSLNEINKSKEEKNNIIEQNFSKNSKNLSEKKENTVSPEPIDTD